MEKSLQKPAPSAHFLDHVKGILYLETGATFNVGRSQLPNEVFESIDRIKRRFTDSGIIGVNDVITAAL
jgi:hypothetical protein